MLNDSSEKAVTAKSGIEKGTATFADNVLTLAGGTAIAIAVTVLASPITSRLFGPEAFGLTPIFAIPYIALVLRHDLVLRNLLSNYFQRVLSFKK